MGWIERIGVWVGVVLLAVAAGGRFLRREKETRWLMWLEAGGRVGGAIGLIGALVSGRLPYAGIAGLGLAIGGWMSRGKAVWRGGVDAMVAVMWALWGVGGGISALSAGGNLARWFAWAGVGLITWSVARALIFSSEEVRWVWSGVGLLVIALLVQWWGGRPIEWGWLLVGLIAGAVAHLIREGDISVGLRIAIAGACLLLLLLIAWS